MPAVVGLLLLLFLFSRMGSGPLAWVQNQAARGSAWITDMGEGMAPEMASEAVQEMTPIVEGAIDLAQAAQDEDIQPIAEPSDGSGEDAAALLPEPTQEPTVEPTVPPTAQPSSTPTDAPTQAPTATATKPPTVAPTTAPTATIRPTATGAPTESGASDDDAILQPTAASTAVTAAAVALVPTETSLPSPTSPPRTYNVQSGDTLSSIAARFGVTVDDLMAVNDIAGGDVYSLRVGEALVIPGSDGQGGPSTLTYTVRAGDTFVTIANRFSLSTEALRIANGMTAAQVRLLRPGQELIIPPDDLALGLEPETPASQPPTATAANAEPTVTPTVAPTVTPSPVPTKSPLRLDAPLLRSPENNTDVSCQGTGQLAWSGVDFITLTDEYVLHLGFVNGVDAAGNEDIVWVLHQVRPPNRTSWEMDSGLCGLAPQEYGRQWRWYVDVVDEEANTVSLPSETWGFSWN